MTTTERPPLPPVVCAPWCEDGGGHTDAVFAEDQTCMGEQHITPTSNGEDSGELGVLAYRWGGDQRSQVCLNIKVGRVDVDVHLTPGQARLLTESLMTVATVVEGTG